MQSDSSDSDSSDMVFPVRNGNFIFRHRVPISQIGNPNPNLSDLVRCLPSRKKMKSNSTSAMPPVQVLAAGYVPPRSDFNHQFTTTRKRKREQILVEEENSNSSIIPLIDVPGEDDWTLNSVLGHPRHVGVLPVDHTGQPARVNGSISYDGGFGFNGIEGPARMDVDDWSLNRIVLSAVNIRQQEVQVQQPPDRMGEEEEDKLVVLFDVNVVDEERPLVTTMTDPHIVVTSVDSGASADQQLASAVTHLPIAKQESGGGGCVSEGSAINSVCESEAIEDLEAKHCSSGSTNCVSELVVSQEDSAKDAKCEPKDAKCEPRESEPEDSEGVGAALTDSLTAKEIKDHLRSFSQFHNADDGDIYNTCQLCMRKKLSFAAPPMDCARCGALIKGSSSFYRTPKDMATPYFFCIPCKNSRGRTITVRELSFPKEELVKMPFADALDEPWVLCDGCQRWQHQTCALYNEKLDSEKEKRYTCPFCRLTELEAGKHATLTTPFGAGDLPRSILGDHIEERLLKNLAQERRQRAESLGKSPQEVPGVADLVVRVVLSVDKQIKVKQPFLNVLQGNTYPPEFPYKSKVILLFQKVDGVEVCLFAMYVQEFGSECEEPNKRSVYISYLDSVKYFTPDVKTVTGLPLRTFVYHDVLVGYLDYCKKRGFTTGYIWACPPLKGDDYILYCHPTTQKTPKPVQLRKWYKTMLKKALDENVVTEWTNFHDHFFVPKDKQNIRITVARLPYFDGSYWNGAIEEFMLKMEKEEACAGDAQKKAKKLIPKRTLKAMGHDALSDESVKDAELMQKLGDKIHSMKEDFIVVHLQHICRNCHEAILSGSRWSCTKCSNYHICAGCLDAKRNPDGTITHTAIHGEKHLLSQVPVDDVVVDTKDKDVILESDIFENRHTFLTFCQARNYQFDTIIHAKHSTMMILYQLHNRSLLTTGTICSICHQEVPVRWHCETCSGFYSCEACYQKEGDGCHVHKLSKQLVKSHCRTNSKTVQQERALQVKTILALLSHTSQCRPTRENPCSYPRCLDMIKLFHHARNHGPGRNCELCKLCKQAWRFLQLHSQYCQDSNCRMPRCKDIKEKTRARSEAQPQTPTVVHLD